MGDEFVQVTTTTDSADRATTLAREIVGAHLGACVQVIGPIRSVYRWHGVVHVDEEWRCQVKTTATLLDALTEHIKTRHTYDLPEIVATPIVGGSEEYLSWIGEQTGNC